MELIAADGLILELDVSDVPVNPLEELCSTLILALQGISARMGWHLEPAWCWLCFEWSGSTVTLIVLISDSFNSKAEERLRITGSVQELVLPWYRALKRFSSRSYGADWPAIDASKIKKLTQVVQAWKLR
ncbi:hypothetical protein [Hymenobacter saemangeumensis]|uniref:hypothetical protein n=1 Tax=Hymenobacter saemangeumensis TaxID=1084522 RepID=UPI0031E6A9DC